jgi:hypothetical protein
VGWGRSKVPEKEWLSGFRIGVMFAISTVTQLAAVYGGALFARGQAG